MNTPAHNNEVANKLSAILKKFDVPDFRRDPYRDGNLQWLSRRMGDRNSGHAQYKDAVELLRQLMIQHNLLRVSAIKEIKHAGTKSS